MKNLECILLVDDDKVCNAVNEGIISMTDNHVKVLTALDGQSALGFLREHGHHSSRLILLDLNMPVMDGLEFLAEFSKLPERKRENVAIVILASSGYENEMERARQYKVVRACVIKPLTPEKMVSIIEECFRDKSGNAKAEQPGS